MKDKIVLDQKTVNIWILYLYHQVLLCHTANLKYYINKVFLYLILMSLSSISASASHVSK